jgi:hypothetical protein
MRPREGANPDQWDIMDVGFLDYFRVLDYMERGKDLGGTDIWISQWFDAPHWRTLLYGHCTHEDTVSQGVYTVPDDVLATTSDLPRLTALAFMAALREAYRRCGIWPSGWKECPDCAGEGIADGEQCEMCHGEGGWHD